MAEFWDLTPAETYQVLEAAVWRDQQRQRQQIAAGWRVAALMRAKKLPPLKQLLTTAPAKRLAGEELRQRRQEYAEAKRALARVDLSKLPPLPPIKLEDRHE